MQIKNEFVVAAPVDQVWAYLLDVERVAPCMPGAQLTEVVDDHTWKGRTNIKVGPVALTFSGTVVLQERDDEAHRVVLKAQGMEQRGKGAAQAVTQSRLEAVEGGTKVVLDTDLTVSGAVAQYGRGMIQDISQRLAGEFALCLESGIAGAASASPEPGPAGGQDASGVRAAGGQEVAGPRAAGRRPDQPVGGLRLGLWALWRAFVRFLRRLIRPGERRGGMAD